MHRFNRYKALSSFINYSLKSATTQRSLHSHVITGEFPSKVHRPSSWLCWTQNSKGMATSTNQSENSSLITEASLPNDSWSAKMLKRYNELMELCGDGKWQKIISYKNFSRDERLFVRAIDAPGKQFEYAMFLNKEEKCIKAVIQFGPWLQGPKGAVHGGAIATVFDSVTGVLAYNMGYRCATINLNVNFHGFLPLYTTAECDAWITKKEGRKIFMEAELRSLDGKTVFDKCSALWLNLDSTDEETLRKQVLSRDGSDNKL